MNAGATSVDDDILLDFRTACADLAEAKRALRAKDSAAARARVLLCVLDRGNASARART